eukprot:c52284_g1_i1.p1 GENE.c52284_g1_i1~~c52284_g1_i1.p1  ORF type:complete len:227 (+),score=26.19 c52284_g1_i1:46-681(+)
MVMDNGELEQALALLLKESKIDEMIQLCETQELESASLLVHVTSSPTIRGIHLICYMITGELEHCRFLWKRISRQTKEATPELGAIWAIGVCLWKHDFEGAHAAISNYAWSDAIQPVISRLQDELRKRVLGLLARAYTAIGVGDVHKYLGLPDSECVQLCTLNGWEYFDDTKLLKTQPRAEAAHSTENPFTLETLSQIALDLERQPANVVL